jgi:DNA helicase-2/ATP-dependent DNA helicase PcrA
VIHNPLDTVSWNRLLLLLEGVGPKKSKDLIAMILQAHGSYEGLKHSTGRSAAGLRHLATTLEQLTEEPLSPAELLGEMLEYYLPLLKDQYDDYPKRIRDLEHLSVMAERYPDLNQFLSDLTLEPPNESVSDVEAPDQDDERLILSTIHSAKGLEWRCVFVIWLVDGRFPSAYSFSDDEGLEEERRLLYVAITRAKQHLFLTYPINVYDKMTGAVLSKPSRYFDHIPLSHFETWNLVEEDQTYSWR